MTHVQSGPSATQLLAWLGADVIKLEQPGTGDITRKQLRDLPDVDSLYFTMLNCNKRSITLNMKTERGQARSSTELIERVRRHRGELRPGRDRPAWASPGSGSRRSTRGIVYASIKGFGPGRTSDFKAYEVVAQAMGGSMSTTGFEDGPPTGDRRPDRRLGHRHPPGRRRSSPRCTSASSTGRGQRVKVAMQRRRAQPLPGQAARPAAAGPRAAGRVPERGASATRSRARATPPAAASPAGRVKCAPGGPNDYIYVIVQPPAGSRSPS